jgi:hypothetical protein
METDTQAKNGDPIYSITTVQDDCLIRDDDDKNPFSNSPVIQDMSADWSHLFNSVITDDDINNALLTVADTMNDDDISVRKNNEAVTATDFTIEDVVSLSNEQILQGMVQPHSTAFKADSVTMSTDMLANISFNTEHKDSNSKESFDAYEEDAFTNKSIQSATDCEILETGKYYSALNDASTDSPCASSPDIIEPQIMVKNIIKDRKTEKNQLCKKPGERSLKLQVLCSATAEKEGQNSDSNTNEVRISEGFHANEVDSDTKRGQGMFQKAGEFKNGYQKKITKRRRCKSNRKSCQQNTHGSRKEMHMGKVNFSNKLINKVKSAYFILIGKNKYRVVNVVLCCQAVATEFIVS